jgi:hypothetical protein
MAVLVLQKRGAKTSIGQTGCATVVDVCSFDAADNVECCAHSKSQSMKVVASRGH